MDNLNKHQIILLALLVAFVVSIATGITVVSLMGQNPQPVVQTINRVVEKTIERVMPATNSNVTNEKTTVVVKEEDLTVNAIDKNVKSLVRIVGPLLDKPDTFIANGIIVSDKGYVVTDKLAILQTNSYTGILSDGSKIPLELVKHDDILGLTLLHFVPAPGQTVNFSAVTWGESNLKLGQTIISLSSEVKNVVNIGNVESLTEKEGKNIAIIANKEVSNSVPGNMLFTLSGEVVGMHVSSEKQVFMASNVIKSAVSALMPK